VEKFHFIFASLMQRVLSDMQDVLDHREIFLALIDASWLRGILCPVRPWFAQMSANPPKFPLRGDPAEICAYSEAVSNRFSHSDNQTPWSHSNLIKLRWPLASF